MVYEDIGSFLNANTDDVVCFCVGTGGCASLASNLVGSAGAAGLPVVLFALDPAMADALQNDCDVVMHDTGSKVDPSKFYEYGSRRFREVIYQELLIGNELLEHGKTLVCMDVDVVVKKDFRKDILRLHEAFPHDDSLFQSNGKGCCAGFYSIKPTKNSVGLFTQKFLDDNNYLSYGLQQQFLNNRVFKKNLLSVQLLDRDAYPNGAHYYKNAERVDPVCKIIHFNCIVGEKKKINRMKKYGYWAP